MRIRSTRNESCRGKDEKLETMLMQNLRAQTKTIMVYPKWPIIASVCILTPVCSLQSSFYTDRIKIRVFNWGLSRILLYSSDKQIIQMVTDIKFAIMKSSIRSSEESLSCFDCNYQQRRERTRSSQRILSNRKTSIAQNDQDSEWIFFRCFQLRTTR